MERYKTIHENNVLISSKIIELEKRQLLRIISLEVEEEMLKLYIKNNPLPFCLKSQNVLDTKFHTSNILVCLIEMIKNNELILNDKK